MMNSLKTLYMLLLLVMVVRKISVLAMLNADPAIELVQYRGKVYYIHKNFFTNYQAALDDCAAAADGGMLTEIGNVDEYLTIQEYIKRFNAVNGLSYVFIGGTDVVKDGDWRLPSTGTPLPFTDWRCHQPYRSDSYNCLSLRSASNWTMYSSKCETNSSTSDVRFMCEAQCRQPRPWPVSDFPILEWDGKQYWFISHYTPDADCDTEGGWVMEHTGPNLRTYFTIAKGLPDIIMLYETTVQNYICVGYNRDKMLISYRDCTPGPYDTRSVLCVRENPIDQCA